MSEAITILRRWYDSDLAYSFRQSPAVMISAFVALTIILAAIFAPLVAPANPFDPGSVRLMDAFTPPALSEGGQVRSCLAPTIRAATCFRPSCTAAGFHCWSVLPRSLSRPSSAPCWVCSAAIAAAGWMWR